MVKLKMGHISDAAKRCPLDLGVLLFCDDCSTLSTIQDTSLYQDKAGFTGIFLFEVGEKIFLILK